MTPYEELERHFERLSQLSDITGMLHWDMEAMMPAGGAEARAAQLATLEVMAHEILTDPSLGDLLEEPSDGLDPWQAANLREMRRRWTHATAVDSDLIAALSKASSNCEMIWRQAKQENDFACVLAPAEELLSLVRQVAEAKGEKLGCAPYDALIDQWEPQSFSPLASIPGRRRTCARCAGAGPTRRPWIPTSSPPFPRRARIAR